jgi:hypothetical protein
MADEIVRDFLIESPDQFKHARERVGGPGSRGCGDELFANASGQPGHAERNRARAKSAHAIGFSEVAFENRKIPQLEPR